MAKPARLRQGGFSYLGLLLMLAITAVGAAATGITWATVVRQEKERELLFIGDQFRQAIANYGKHTPGTGGRYPRRLDDLLKDPRYPNTRRYLRRIYADPITGREEWGLIKNFAGEIVGVHSLSEQEPLKKANFSLADARFEGRKKYSEWQFSHLPVPTSAATAGSSRRR